MPSANLITTTAGRAAILGALAGSSTLVVDDVQLSDTNQVVDVGTTALSNIVATLEAEGSVVAAGPGHALHIVIKDDSTAAYDVRALAVRLDDGTFLMVYSQLGLLATKIASSSLHLAFDLAIDEDTAATITFGGSSYLLPAASEDLAGVVELATVAEVDAAHITRVVTGYQLDRIYDRTRHYMALSNWTKRTPAASYAGEFTAIAFGAGVFVAVGSSGEIQTSPDGTTWTHRTAAASYADYFRAVHYNAGEALFVAVGDAGEIQTSPDGITWTHRTAAASYAGSFRAVTYGAADDRWVIAGETGEIQTSPDGITWTHRTAAASYAGTFNGVAYNSTLDLFVLVGNYTPSTHEYPEVQTSPDGTTWTRRETTTDPDINFVDLYCVASASPGFMASGGSGRSVFSLDGITWTSSGPSGVTSTAALAIAAGDGCFAVLASNNSKIWVVSPDGAKIDVLPRSGTLITLADLVGICFVGRRFVAVGSGGVILESLYL